MGHRSITNACAAAISARSWERDGGAGAGGRGGSEANRGWWAAAAVAFAVGAGGLGDKKWAKNCGIVGVVSAGETGGAVDAREFLLEVMVSGAGKFHSCERNTLT